MSHLRVRSVFYGSVNSKRDHPPPPRAFSNFSFPRVGHLLKQVSPGVGHCQSNVIFRILKVVHNTFILNFLKLPDYPQYKNGWTTFCKSPKIGREGFKNLKKNERIPSRSSRNIFILLYSVLIFVNNCWFTFVQACPNINIEIQNATLKNQKQTLNLQNIVLRNVIEIFCQMLNRNLISYWNVSLIF